MLQLLLAAPSSGSGKTTAACALLSALKARGLEPCAFKCGPDYIDPMFHRAVLGVPSHNLDLFFSTPQTVRRLYTSGAAGHGSAVCEGAMGYYDGLGGVSATASAWHTADVLDLPVLLVVRPKGGQFNAGRPAARLKSVPHAAPHCGRSAERLHRDAVQAAGPHAGTGNRPAGGGLSAPHAGCRHRKPPPGAENRGRNC